MPDYNTLLNVMKEAGAKASDANNPVNVCFGKVMSASPLKILVEQKITLSSAQLVLTKNVTDHEVSVTVDWSTGNALGTHTHGVTGNTKNGGEDSHNHSVSLTTGDADLKHSHEIDGNKKMTIHNALQTGDEVLLLRVQGGQKYIVIDKVG